MGWLWRQVVARLYRGNNLQQGSRSIHKGLVTMEYANAAKNYGIEERKVLEYTRQSTAHEAVDSGAGWPRDGTSRSHIVASRRDFSCGGF